MWDRTALAAAPQHKNSIYKHCRGSAAKGGHGAGLESHEGFSNTVAHADQASNTGARTKIALRT